MKIKSKDNKENGNTKPETMNRLRSQSSYERLRRFFTHLKAPGGCF